MFGLMLAGWAHLPGPPPEQQPLAPALLAGDPRAALPDWRAAQCEAAALSAAAHRARAALEARIGSRGLLLGTLHLPSGRAIPIHPGGPEAAKKLLRRLHVSREWAAERTGIVAAVSAACRRWDAEAERAGLGGRPGHVADPPVGPC